MSTSNVSTEKRRTVIIVSSILLTIVYWIVALWYQNKTAYSKDLVVFHFLFGKGGQWQDLLQYIFQFAITILLFAFVPFLITKHYLKTDFTKLGLQLTYNKQAFLICAVAYPIVIASTYFSSQDPLIAAEYPLSKLIGSSWFIFIAYQISYLFYFLSYEIFYRGYLQFGLKSEQAKTKELLLIILFQTILTTLFHIGKPTPEIISAAAFGPVFGYVAFRYNSIWYGMIIHFVMNIFIDLFSLHWLNLLPLKLF
jgi:membrane protease YdiL (CAAX protease family)